MTRETLVNNCAVFAARAVTNATYAWCEDRIQMEYNQYCMRNTNIKADTFLTYEELKAAGKDVMSIDTYSILFILNKYAEYNMYFLTTLSHIPEEELSIYVAMELVANLYIERFGGILALFNNYNKEHDYDKFFNSDEFARAIKVDPTADAVGLTLIRDVLPYEDMTTGNMFTILPVLKTREEYLIYYELLKVLARVVEEA